MSHQQLATSKLAEIGLYTCGETADSQIGFARLISDYTSFAYLCDVFILPQYQDIGAI